MKILVTGGTGFLGSYVVRDLLAEGHSVRILTRNRKFVHSHKDIEIRSGQIDHEKDVFEASCGVDAVFHVAAKADIWGHKDSFYRANVVATQNVINACLKNEIPRLVYTSTPSVVFNGKSIENGNESLPYGSHFLCHYAQTKAWAEQLVLKANKANQLCTIALRPHLIWGVGDNHLIPRVLQRAKEKKLRIIGNGDNYVGITHVENASFAHILALRAIDRGVGCGKAYFISQNDPVSLWDWINHLLRKLNINPVTKKIPLPIAYGLGATFEWLYNAFSLNRIPPMTRFLAVELAKHHYFDISAAKRDLGYYEKISTQDGVLALVEELREGR